MEPNELVNIKPIEELIDKLSASSVFGEPTREHDAVVIPVAQVGFGFGYGGGYGEGPTGSDGAEASEGTADAEGAVAEGAGGGGGAGGRVSPRGFIRISPSEVTYEPIEDEKVIPLAGIFMVAWSVFWIAATIRYIAKQVAKTKQTSIKNA